MIYYIFLTIKKIALQFSEKTTKVEHSKENVKWKDTQLKKLKNAVKNKTGTTLKLSLKMFDGNNLSHESLLTTRHLMHLITISQLI